MKAFFHFYEEIFTKCGVILNIICFWEKHLILFCRYLFLSILKFGNLSDFRACFVLSNLPKLSRILTLQNVSIARNYKSKEVYSRSLCFISLSSE